MRPTALALALVAAGCTKEKKEGAPPPPPKHDAVAQVDAAPVAAVAVDAAVLASDCGPELSDVLGKVGRAQRAMDATGAIDGAREAWTATRAACRNATWYRAAAILVRVGAATPLAADGVQLVGTQDALAHGLAVEPGDLALLGYVAYLSGIDATLSPALPADACDRATASPAPAGKAAEVREHDELVAYVCGQIDLAAQRWDDAAAKLGAITDPPYPDVGVRLVQAIHGGGTDKAARANVDAADQQIDRYLNRLGVIPPDADVLRAQLTQRD